MAIIGESRSERRDREAQKDDNRLYSQKMSEKTGETLEYTDQFTQQVPLDNSVLDRLPKCLLKKETKMVEENQNTETTLVPIQTQGADELAIDLDRVSDGLKTIKKFQEIVKKLTTKGVDYGVIPGTQKPTLLKPGAEKITKLMSLADTYIILRTEEDYDKPFFAYTVKCQLTSLKTNHLISEGMGQCNSKESKYRWRWVFDNELPPDVDKDTLKKQTGMSRWKKPYTRYRVENEDVFSQVNTILKMAKKRALVDAALSAGRLSEIFTQDVEDMRNNIPEQKEANAKPAKPKATKDQNMFKTIIKEKLIKTAKELGYTEDMMVIDAPKLSRLIWNTLGGRWPESDKDVLSCIEVIAPKDFMSAEESKTVPDDELGF